MFFFDFKNRICRILFRKMRQNMEMFFLTRVKIEKTTYFAFGEIFQIEFCFVKCDKLPESCLLLCSVSIFDSDTINFEIETGGNGDSSSKVEFFGEFFGSKFSSAEEIESLQLEFDSNDSIDLAGESVTMPRGIGTPLSDGIVTNI